MGLIVSPEGRAGRNHEAGALACWHHVQEGEVAVTDESLIQGILSRDEAALAILYARFAAIVYSVVRPILTEESDAKEIVLCVFYRIWCKASDFKPASGTVLEFLKVTARKCAFDQFPGRGFENGGLFSLGHSVPAFNVDLMTRVLKTVANLPRPELGSRVEIAKFEDSNWAESDHHMEQLIIVLRDKMRATLKALRELPLLPSQSGKQSKQEELRSQPEER